MEENFIEKRKNRRYLLEGFGKLINVKNGESKECYIFNISIGGGMIYLNGDNRIGDLFKLRIEAGGKIFERDCVIRAIRDFSQKRKYILQIGKSLDVTSFANIMFMEVLSINDVEFIRKNI